MEYIKTCPLCDGSQCVVLGPAKGECCDYCIEGEILTMEGEKLAMLIKKYISEA